MAAPQVINEVLLAQGQAVPEWLCKSGYLEISRTARHRLSLAKPEPVSVYLLVQPWPRWAEASPQECSDSSKASAPATISQGRLALQQARRQPRCRTDWDSPGKETNPFVVSLVCWCPFGVCSFPCSGLGTSHQWLRQLVAPKVGTLLTTLCAGV